MSSTERGKPLKRLYREFGLVAGSILLAVGLIPMLRHGAPRLWALAVASSVYVISAAVPGLLAVPYRFMVRLGHVLGAVNAKVVLGLFYFLFFVPIALVMKAAGKRPIDDSFKTGKGSYWRDREKRTDVKSFEHMF